MRTIELTKGQVALVDDEDYENLSKFNWRCRKCTDNLFYASLYLYKDGKSVTIGMHRFIMNVSDRKLVVDHIDHNGLNNQKSNLRVCTVSENAKNSRSRRGSSSIYLGVCVLKIKTLKGFRIRIQAKINNNGKKINLGYFDTEELAAKAYDEAAKLYHGEFANLNFK